MLEDLNAPFAIKDTDRFVQMLMSCANDMYSLNITALVQDWQFKDLLEKRNAGYDEHGHILATPQIVKDICADAFSIFLGCVLNEMVNEGKIDCAFDDEKNDFVFTVPKSETTDT